MADGFDRFKARLLENPKIKAEYDALAPEYELIERLITARKATKENIHMRVDTDVLEWYKSQGKGYQTKMNAVLRAYAFG